MADGRPLFEAVFEKCGEWNTRFGNVGCVVGATQASMKELREKNSDLVFLVPGVGAQGGSYHDSIEQGRNRNGVVLINLSRSLLYCTETVAFPSVFRDACQKLILA